MDNQQGEPIDAYKFYVCSVGQPGEGYDEENLERCEKYNAHFLHKNTAQKGTFDSVAAPAVAILKYKDKLVAYGEVVKAWVDDDNSELGEWAYRIDVKEWIWKDPNNHEEGVSKYGVGWSTVEGSQYATIKQVDAKWGLEKVKEIDENSDFIKNLYYMQELLTLLKSNYNLILTGAPGTGKTYLAKRMASKMILGKEYGEEMSEDESKIFNEHCEFAQFHPSYDYTDFVEGLRPTKDAKGNIGFERQDGVFKKFCAKALKELRVDVTDNFDEAWKNLMDTIAEKGQIEVPLLSEKRNMELRLSEGGDGIMEYQEGKDIGNNSLFAPDKLYNIYQGGKGTPSGAHDTYRRAVIEEMALNYGLKEYNPEKIKKYDVEKDKPFIMIIDEINRGDISKIFGELFFSIDPGYRGAEKGRVNTQYQNLIEENDAFYGGFYVPENVYIIGTMNDIDRSVESMDFAMRRRFAWKEIKAETQVSMLSQLGDKRDEAVNRMRSLNNEISKTENLTSAYHIGPSYFLKLLLYKADPDGGWESLWNNHIEGVLREYLRGADNVDGKEGKITKLYKAYDSGKNDVDKVQNNAKEGNEDAEDVENELTTPINGNDTGNEDEEQ